MKSVSLLKNKFKVLLKYDSFNWCYYQFRVLKKRKRFFAKLNWEQRLESIDPSILQNLSEKEKRSLPGDLLNAQIKHGASFVDYFNYEFYKKSDIERNEFITEVRSARFWSSYNPTEYDSVFRNKFQTYTKFKKYYGREILWVTDEVNLKEFENFCARHKKIVIKPYDGTFGIGVRIVEIKNGSQIEKLFQECLKYKLIVEEVISQNLDMAAFHPSSINTIRVNTVITKNETRIMSAAFRMGNNNSIVDNYSSGGIFTTIDIETGIVFTRGRDKFYKWYIKHPQTDNQILGFKVPQWEDIKSFAKELATIFPKIRYVGWDIVLTDTGNLLVIEGNNCAGFDVQQAADQIGKRRIYEEALFDI
jgi:hypothetical protein